jgi:glutamyl-tRNA reductase
VEDGNHLIEEAVEETVSWLLSSRMDATIESLQQRCDEIVEDTYSYLNRKMDLSAREQKLLKKMLRASLHRLLREPILELKQLDGAKDQETYRKVVEDLFHIDHA